MRVEGSLVYGILSRRKDLTEIWKHSVQIHFFIFEKMQQGMKAAWEEDRYA